MPRPMKITFVLPQPGLSGGIRVIAITRTASNASHDVLVVHPLNARPSLKKRTRSVLRGIVPAFRTSTHRTRRPGVPRKILDRWRPVVTQDVPDADVVIATW